jgi:hypothetical protein
MERGWFSGDLKRRGCSQWLLMVGFVDVMGDALGADVDLPDRHGLLGQHLGARRPGTVLKSGASTHSRGSRNQQEYGAPTDRALRFLADR